MSWPLDPQAGALLGRSHTVAGRLRASVNGSQFVLDLPLVEGTGSVKLDGSSLTRRTLDATVVATIDDPRVDPIAGEVRAEYLISDVAGNTWAIPAGVYVITAAVEASPGTVKITGADRWQRIIDARFERPTTTSGNTVDAIRTLLLDADGRITVNVQSGVPTTATHAPALWDRDRGEAIKKLAQSIGCVVYFDAAGVAQIAPQPALGDTSVWQVGRGAGGVKVSSQRGAKRESTYNAVSGKSEPQGLAPLYSVRRITDGRLAYGGGFGKRTRFVSTNLVTAQADLDRMVEAALARVSGVPRTLDLEVAPNPALEYGDVLVVEVAAGLWERHMVQGYTLPLGLGTQPIATRTDAATDEELEGD